MKCFLDYINYGYGAHIAEINHFTTTVLSTDLSSLSIEHRKNLLNLLDGFFLTQPNYNNIVLEKLEKIYNDLDESLKCNIE